MSDGGGSSGEEEGWRGAGVEGAVAGCVVMVVVVAGEVGVCWEAEMIPTTKDGDLAMKPVAATSTTDKATPMDPGMDTDTETATTGVQYMDTD